ncbi:MAG: MGMT family protein [Dehalococcoidia bacterium]|nr:MGMT family protein [Dehalococcoidia bacterium]
MEHRPSDGQTFYDQVYELVGQVPPGSVVTYGQVALMLGSPAAARAVGYALSYLGPSREVPWWRVINAQGGISLKNRGSSADLQRELLEAEGIAFNTSGHCDLGLYRWWPDGWFE